MIDTVDYFDFSKEPLLSINFNDTKKQFTLDSTSALYKEIVKKDNYYKLIKYSLFNTDNDVEKFTIYGDWDYYRNILLATYCDDRYFIYVLATASGDGEDFYFKKSYNKNGIFYSNFVKGNRTFTTPKDSIFFKLKGTSMVYIQSDGKIVEDTIEIKRNYLEIKNETYNIEENY
jgi:hypothetical protein